MPARGGCRGRLWRDRLARRASCCPRAAAATNAPRPAVAITGAQSSLLAVAFAIQDVADACGPLEVRSSADALQRAALGLEELLAALAPTPAYS